MGPSQDAYAANVLKAVTYRLSAVPAKQLPALIPHVTATLPACKLVLSAPQNASGKDASETAVLVHKLRTQISTLLQDRSTEGRWSAVVLSKCAIELGGWEMLQKSGPWVRGLLGILTKPDPPTTKVLAIVTLTRIFMLTRDYQTLVREITTPSLTPFITSCLNTLSRAKNGDQGTQQLVETVLESFARLLPRHPTTFRPHLSKINQFLSQVVAQSVTAENMYLSSDGLAAARSLYAQLPNCAAKNGFKEEWETSLQKIVTAAHQAANKVFRAVIEDWESVTGVQPPSTTNRTLDMVVEQSGPDQCGFPGWTGIYAGSARLIGLLELLAELTASPTAPSGPVSFRIAHVMDLLTRVLSITAPAGHNKKNQECGISFNDQIGKEERNDLFTVLPQIHIAALSLFETLVERFGSSMSPVIEFFIDRLSFVFQEEKSLANVRAASYYVLSKVLPTVGSTLSAAQVKALNSIMHACCEDLLPRDPDTTIQSHPATINGNKNQQQISMNADSFLTSTKKMQPQQLVYPDLYRAAHELLPLLLSHVPAEIMDNSIRARIDGTAVLIKHEEAMLASVLSLDPRGNPSLLPLAARLYPNSPAVESLLRPRVPAIRPNANRVLNVAEEEEEEDEGEDEEVEVAETAEQNTEVVPFTQYDKMQLDDAPAEASQSEPVGVRSKHAEKDASTTDQDIARGESSSTSGPEKRPSTETEVQSTRSPKRPRVASPPRDVPKAGQQEPAASTLPAAVPFETGYGEEDDDGDVEVPTLIMSEDEDEEEESGEEE
ncbi:rRNA processing/ribosome biogenesis-domain-containing protein [Macrophomina phaseolina]|uniref:Pre-rRNA-processing protein RIX1 n=1 Tax=Macrophomina phaseolina TaxID=35725 RepID=A0ABQ8GEK1_9PEZI|nr:rRNA processing/ribosome biogenesis-domain-containing protein [Macrophomina phaseolina]